MCPTPVLTICLDRSDSRAPRRRGGFGLLFGGGWWGSGRLHRPQVHCPSSSFETPVPLDQLSPLSSPMAYPLMPNPLFCGWWCSPHRSLWAPFNRSRWSPRKDNQHSRRPRPEPTTQQQPARQRAKGQRVAGSAPYVCWVALARSRHHGGTAQNCCRAKRGTGRGRTGSGGGRLACRRPRQRPPPPHRLCWGAGGWL